MKKLETLINNKESIGLFIGGIAHDFNNLLTSIMVNSSLALTGFNENDPVYKNLSSITDAAKEASDLLHQFSKCYNKKPLDYEVIDFNKIARPIIEKYIIEKYNDNISADYSLKDNLWQTKANIPSLSLVLKSIFEYAYKEIKAGGCIKIHSKNSNITEKEAKNSTKVYAGDFICLSISYKRDEILEKKETNDNLFNLFYSKNFINFNEETEFFISQRILHQHHGWINQSENVKEKFKTIEIFLPAIAAKMNNVVNT